MQGNLWESTYLALEGGTIVDGGRWIPLSCRYFSGSPPKKFHLESLVLQGVKIGHNTNKFEDSYPELE